MALRLSTGLRNFLLQQGSLAGALENGELRMYSGSQPSSANNAPTGTLLATITANSATRTAETLASGSIELTAGGSGSIDTLTVDGINIIDNVVPFNTSLAQTAIDLAAEINRSISAPDYRASVSSATVTITALRGTGAIPNTFAVAGTLTTLTATYTALSGGVNAANGLRFGVAADGTVGKATAQNWTGAAVANGTAGYYRFVGSVLDSDGTDALGAEIRMDGAISTSGAELNLPSLTIATSAVQTITSLQISLPAG